MFPWAVHTEVRTTRNSVGYERCELPVQRASVATLVPVAAAAIALTIVSSASAPARPLSRSTHARVTFDVRGTVRASCLFDTPQAQLALVFDPERQGDNIVAHYHYRCTNGTSVFATVGAGRGGGAAGTSVWTMRDAHNDPLKYTLFEGRHGAADVPDRCENPRDAKPVKIDTPFEVQSGRGGGPRGERLFNICGNVASNQTNVKPGDYSDDVTLTLAAQ
jgi:spore coat protein U-like protein